MLEKINKKQLEELRTHRLNLNHLWMLEKLYKAEKEYNGDGTEIEAIINDSEIDTRGLYRRGFATPAGITEEGKVFYEAVIKSKSTEEVSGKVRKKREKVNDDFSRLWDAFPRNSIHETKGIYYGESRPLRKNEDKCRSIYEKTIAGRYEIEDILKALEYEVWSRKNSSTKKNGVSDNKMAFMNGLEPWLNQKIFEAYLGMEIPTEKESKSIRTDDLF